MVYYFYKFSVDLKHIRYKYCILKMFFSIIGIYFSNERSVINRVTIQHF